MELKVANRKVLKGIDIPGREKLILAGLYLSKYDSIGLQELGFDSFQEAFNVIGFALEARPASIKNYRDEFDPRFSNPRRGWHKRPTRDYCLLVLERYKELDFESFTALVKSFFGRDQNIDDDMTSSDSEGEVVSSFAQRLITGLAAEHYFESVRTSISEFKDHTSENTTRLGCGYDFRLRLEPNDKNFLAIEVKGLREQGGSLSMTPKEYQVASMLENRFFLFVVRNFREVPSHKIYQNPLAGSLRFTKAERVVIQTSWRTTV